MSKDLCYSSLGKEKEPEEWRKLHVGGIDGISCPHLQVMMTQLLQKNIVNGKTTEGRYGTAARVGLLCTSPTTAFDVARPKWEINTPMDG